MWTFIVSRPAARRLRGATGRIRRWRGQRSGDSARPGSGATIPAINRPATSDTAFTMILTAVSLVAGLLIAGVVAPEPRVASDDDA
jgi:hypothetical protein